MKNNHLKKIKRLSNELNAAIHDFENKKGIDEDELKNWIFSKYEELGDQLQRPWQPIKV